MKSKTGLARGRSALLMLLGLALLGFRREDVEFRCYPMRDNRCAIGQAEAGAVLVSFKKAPVSLAGEFYELPVVFKAYDPERLLWGAFFPAGRNFSPGEYLLHIFAREDSGESTEFILPVLVEERVYPVEELTLPKAMVELSPEAVERVNQDNKILLAAMSEVSREILWQGAFVPPLEASLDGNFGTRRVVNGIAKSPHNGVDLPAFEGQEIRAPNYGKVAIVYDGYLTGKGLILDHGGGLYSVYFHLSEVKVKAGEKVSRGQVVALAGKSGAATGPHLHFALRLAKNYVNPKTIVEASLWLEETVSRLAGKSQ